MAFSLTATQNGGHRAYGQGPPNGDDRRGGRCRQRGARHQHGQRLFSMFLLVQISTFPGSGGQWVLGHVHGHEQSLQQDRPRRLADRCRGHEEQTPWERYWSIFKQKFLTISFSAKEKEKQGYFLIIWLICTKLNSSATNLSQADKGQSFLPESTQSSWALLNCDR